MEQKIDNNYSMPLAVYYGIAGGLVGAIILLTGYLMRSKIRRGFQYIGEKLRSFKDECGCFPRSKNNEGNDKDNYQANEEESYQNSGGAEVNVVASCSVGPKIDPLDPNYKIISREKFPEDYIAKLTEMNQELDDRNEKRKIKLEEIKKGMSDDIENSRKKMNESDKKIDDDIENLRNEMGNDFKRHDETKRRLEKLEQQVLITSIVADYGLRVVQNCQKTVSAGNKELEEAANGLYESGAKVDQQIEYKENVLHPMHEVIVNGKDPI